LTLRGGFPQLPEGKTATEQEIREFCKVKMDPYKVSVAVEFVEEIPRSASGKAMRRMLRDKDI
jgi:long-chain acyl-CoA synthetase